MHRRFALEELEPALRIADAPETYHHMHEYAKTDGTETAIERLRMLDQRADAPGPDDYLVSLRQWPCELVEFCDWCFDE